MVIYDKNLLKEYSEKIKKGSLVFFFPLVIALMICAVLCFLLNEDKSNATVLHVLAVVISVLAGWFSITVLFAYVLPAVKKRKTIQRLLAFAKRQACGKVVAMDNYLTLSGGVRVLEIQSESNGKQSSFYFDTQLKEPDFNVGDTLEMIIADNFIFSYKVESHEEEV